MELGMKLELKQNPREFGVGKDQKIILKDMGNIYLDLNEQITFMTLDKQEYDVCRKEWGYYATPSVNDRLKRFGFKTALVRNVKGQVYIMLVDQNKIDLFNQYLSEESNFVLKWLDEEPLI